MDGERFDPDLLNEEDPFEIDDQVAHLFKHPHLGSTISMTCGPATPFFTRQAPAHWLMCAAVGGQMLTVPLAPVRSGDPRRCRPIGCHEASQALAAQYRKDSR